MADPHDQRGSEDAGLWSQALAGDEAAFESLYDRHAEAVHRLLLRRVGAQDAPDLTAEVFARAWTHRCRIQLADDGGLLPWLLGTALNVARRHDERSAAEGRMTNALARAYLPIDPIAEVIDAIDDAVALQRARAALARLSLEDQEVLLLCVVEGLSSPAAGAVLGLAPGTVRSRLFRARQRLAAAFDGMPPSGEAP